MGYIMYKGQSIDYSIYKKKDSSKAETGYIDSPVSYLNEKLPDSDNCVYNTAPVLFYNKKYLQKYYIGQYAINDDDIPIGVLIGKAKRYDQDIMWPDNLDNYFWDDDKKYLHFISFDFMSFNTPENGSKTAENIYWGDNKEELLKGYTYDLDERWQPESALNQFYWVSHIYDSTDYAISNTEICWENYDKDHPGWKTDTNFNTYAKSCYLYHTPGTNQGDWKMIDLNYYAAHCAGKDDRSGANTWSFPYVYTQETFLKYNYLPGKFNNNLTAFAWIDKEAYIHEGLIKNGKGCLGYRSDWQSGTTYLFTPKMYGTARAMLRLPANIFKFKTE